MRYRLLSYSKLLLARPFYINHHTHIPHKTRITISTNMGTSIPLNTIHGTTLSDCLLHRTSTEIPIITLTDTHLHTDEATQRYDKSQRKKHSKPPPPPPYTHFLSFPILHTPTLINRYNEWKDTILNDNEFSHQHGILENQFIHPNAFHLTAIMLPLGKEKDPTTDHTIQQCITVIEQCRHRIHDIVQNTIHSINDTIHHDQSTSTNTDNTPVDSSLYPTLRFDGISKFPGNPNIVYACVHHHHHHHDSDHQHRNNKQQQGPTDDIIDLSHDDNNATNKTLNHSSARTGADMHIHTDTATADTDTHRDEPTASGTATATSVLTPSSITTSMMNMITYVLGNELHSGGILSDDEWRRQKLHTLKHIEKDKQWHLTLMRNIDDPWKHKKQQYAPKWKIKRDEKRQAKQRQLRHGRDKVDGDDDQDRFIEAQTTSTSFSSSTSAATAAVTHVEGDKQAKQSTSAIPFNAQSIVDRYRNQSFGEVPISSIQLCKRYADPKTKAYKVLHHMDFS